MGLELTTLVVIETDCTCSCKSNYNTIMTTTIPEQDSRDQNVIVSDYFRQPFYNQSHDNYWMVKGT